MHGRQIATWVVVAAFGMGSFVVQAQTQVVTPVPYVTGGIGSDERETLLQEARQEGYNLKIVAAATGGAYLAAVTVRIADADGKEVLQAAMDGPWLYAKLPAGRYMITADDGTDSHKRAVQLPASGTREVVFRWQRKDNLPKGMEPERERSAR